MNAAAFLAESFAVLERTPATLSALLQGLPEAWTAAREGADTFSPRDIVGHLIHGEDTDWLPRIRLILAKGEAEPFLPFDRFGFRGVHDRLSLADLLALFGERRRESLAAVRQLDLREVDLSRRGRHPELGVVTLRQLLATWVTHDLNHIGQAVRVMASRNWESVGPWRAYLGIFSRP